MGKFTDQSKAEDVKKILSISVGSSSRDHTTRHVFLGQACELSRKGTDGDFEKAVQMYREYDGKVDAFGVGGTEFYLQVGKRRYYFRDVKRIRAAVKISKIGDGNGVKGLLERRAFAALEKYLNEKENRSLRGLPALQTTAEDRYKMSEAMVSAGLESPLATSCSPWACQSRSRNCPLCACWQPSCY